MMYIKQHMHAASFIIIKKLMITLNNKNSADNTLSFNVLRFKLYTAMRFYVGNNALVAWRAVPRRVLTSKGTLDSVSELEASFLLHGVSSRLTNLLHSVCQTTDSLSPAPSSPSPTNSWPSEAWSRDNSCSAHRVGTLLVPDPRRDPDADC